MLSDVERLNNLVDSIDVGGSGGGLESIDLCAGASNFNTWGLIMEAKVGRTNNAANTNKALLPGYGRPLNYIPKQSNPKLHQRALQECPEQR